MTSKSIFKILIFIVLNYSSAFAIEIADFMANEEGNPGFYRQGYVVAAFDANGNYVVAWRDFRSSPAKAHFQLYNTTGGTLGENVEVAEVYSNTGSNIVPLAITMNAFGQFVIYYQQGIGQGHIARYEANGQPDRPV